MNNNPHIIEIKEFLSHVRIRNKVDHLNLVAWVYDRIKDSDSPENCFSFFLDNADSIESDETCTVDARYSSNDLERLKKEFGRITDVIFEKMLEKNLDESKFYYSLWNALSNNPLLDTTESVVFAIYYILIDSRIPYFKLSKGITMSNAQFARITDKIQRDIHKARFIIKTPQFGQKTARASVLLELLDSKTVEEERVVLMAQILSFSGNRPSIPDSLLEALLRSDESE